MKFIVDEMPAFKSDCPFCDDGQPNNPECCCGPEYAHHLCVYFINGGYNSEDCPHLKPLHEDTGDGTIKDSLPF